MMFSKEKMILLVFSPSLSKLISLVNMPGGLSISNDANKRILPNSEVFKARVRHNWVTELNWTNSLELLFCGLRGLLGSSFPGGNQFQTCSHHFFQCLHPPYKTTSLSSRYTSENEYMLLLTMVWFQANMRVSSPSPPATTISSHVNPGFNPFSKVFYFSQKCFIRCRMRNRELPWAYFRVFCGSQPCLHIGIT